jgi:hypothetical protein
VAVPPVKFADIAIIQLLTVIINFTMMHILGIPSISSIAPWFPDITANYHIQPDLQNLTAVNEYSGPDHLVVGKGQGLLISHTGNGIISTPHASLSLQNVVYVPTIQKIYYMFKNLPLTTPFSLNFGLIIFLLRINAPNRS